MYATHVEIIGQKFDQSPAQTLENIVKFTLASIQQQFNTVPAILSEWEQLGEEASTMWGMKRDGVRYIQENSTRLAALIRFHRNRGLDEDTLEVIDLLLEIPGLNTIKAGFVAQILGFPVGCIDTVNQQLYGIDVKSFNIPKGQRQKTRHAKIAAYVTLCQKLGGAEQLWDVWCHNIAQKYGSYQGSSEAVSAQHVDCIIRP